MRDRITQHHHSNRIDLESFFRLLTSDKDMFILNMRNQRMDADRYPEQWMHIYAKWLELHYNGALCSECGNEIPEIDTLKYYRENIYVHCAFCNANLHIIRIKHSTYISSWYTYEVTRSEGN